MTNEEPSDEDLLEALRSRYCERHRENEFIEEEPFLRTLISKARSQIGPTFYFFNPIRIGSTATIWEVRDRLNRPYALKLTRPRIGRLDRIRRVIRAESDRLAGLRHDNLIRVYDSGEIDIPPHTFPYYVMDLVEDASELHDFVAQHASITGTQLLLYVRDILEGLSYLHTHDIVHCDVKPGNILVSENRPALLVDLGYSKLLPRGTGPEGDTEMAFTMRFAHPSLRKLVNAFSDPDAARTPLHRQDVLVGFDLFALGKTLQTLLTSLQRGEGGPPPTIDPYQWTYLQIIAKRLLDGTTEPDHVDPADPTLAPTIPGLAPSAMAELKYASADEAIADIEKVLHLYDLEGVLPELNPNIQSYIQIPHAKAPLTPRIKRLISHETFRRLAHVTQLGFVSWVYPGATHMRFEHSLGTYAHCVEYVRALWYDQANPFFQCVMSIHDIEVVLAAALLHDIAQYPMAHDLAEIATGFAHESFTRQQLYRRDGGTGESLADILASSEWDISLDELMATLHGGERIGLRQQLLHSIISGPIDCDKLDYMRRDSSHVGVPSGQALDSDRILRNLTVVYGGDMPLNRIEIGVNEKALSVAQVFVNTRRELFSQVYWHHSVRSLKAMLGYAVRRALMGLTDEDKRAAFWSDFVGMAYGGGRPRGGTPIQPRLLPAEGDAPSWLLTEEDAGMLAGVLAASDEELLRFLAAYDNGFGNILEDIRLRRLYRRLSVLSSAFGDTGEIYHTIYEGYRAYRLEDDVEKIEGWRIRVENSILNQMETSVSTGEVWEQVRSRLPHGASFTCAADLVSALRLVHPLILFDVPIRSLRKGQPERVLWYVPEERAGVRVRHDYSTQAAKAQAITVEQRAFDMAAGKIRVFAHPQWCSVLAVGVSDDNVRRTLVR